MKNVFLSKVVLLAALGCIFVGNLQAKKKENDGHRNSNNVLMLGLNDNVKSNYFPKVMITEETGIMEDVIDREYNAIIMENIMASASGACKFIPTAADTHAHLHKLCSLIKVNGEGDESYSDLSPVPDDEYRKALDMADAEYLMVVNQHYLKWQEKPMRTLFHIVSYTLYDKDKNEVYRGNHYFTSMNLERPENIRKISRKASSRIASTIVNQIKLNEA